MSIVNLNRNNGSLKSNAESAYSSTNNPALRAQWDFTPFGFSNGANFQYHHIHAVSSFTPHLNVMNDIYNRAGRTFDINDANNAVVLPNSGDVQAAAANNGTTYAVMHNNTDGFHVEYNRFHSAQVEAAIERYTKVRDRPGATQAQIDTAARSFTVEMDNLRTTMLNGLRADSPDGLLFFTNSDDRIFNQIATASGNNGDLREFYAQHLGEIESRITNHREPIEIVRTDAGGTQLMQGGKVLGAPIYPSKLARTITRIAIFGGAAVITAPLLSLFFAGEAQAYVARRDNVSRESVSLSDLKGSDIKEFIESSNLDVGDVNKFLQSFAAGAAVDLALSLAASLTGFGLLWKGYEVYQNYSDIRGALDLAVQANPGMETLRGVRDAILSVEETLIGIFGDDVTGGGDTLSNAPPRELSTLEQIRLLNAFYDGLPADQRALIDQMVRERTGIPGAVWRLLNEDARQDIMEEFFKRREQELADALPPEHCFLAGTSVVRPDGTTTPIEEMRVGDWVTAYDGDGNLVPGRVSAVHRNRVEHILDVHGLMVTPGHVTLCGDGPYAGKHVPIIDILRTDGALVREDNSKVRASTGVPLGHEDDSFVWAVTGERQPDGSIRITEKRRIRLGTRVNTASGHGATIHDLIRHGGGYVTDTGLVRHQETGAQAPFLWAFGPRLPRPEDYVLQRSGLSLFDLYDQTGTASSDLSMRQ